ncbi:GGDEF domain-containing protein [Aquabacterium lacunae]|uniref:diguanylate cyclase n=1 Tax=Aquabacterium lacunae TaxID=2528630 RepID=A0A4Q9H2L9_9BURK|nr:GGDEF domain-containing protein [Aquabacterium lacunae]TBO34268.1 GGDEF domain-containing protein [Aquabacterium lacunae]
MNSPQGAMEQLVTLTSLRDREQLDQGLAQALCRILDAHEAGVHRTIRDGEGQRRWFKCAKVTASGGFDCDPSWAEPESLPAFDDEPLRQQALEDPSMLQVPTRAPLPPGWLTVMPLNTDDGEVGVVELVTPDSLGIQAVRTVHTVLQVFDNFLRLLASSQRDPLTGLLNRQTFDTSFLSASLRRDMLAPGDTDRRQRVGDQWWLGVLDIDFFKKVNDQYGHLIGDEVLVLVARLMRQTFRHYDRLFRFGGEEFVVMVRCPEEAGALAAFDRFRQRVASYAFPQVGQVTVSVGFTSVQPSDSPSAAFSRADVAVYHAKHHGRNRVISHPELLRAGTIKDANLEGDVELF